MKNISLIRKYAAILLSVSVAFPLEACAKEQTLLVEPIGIITMTTRDSEEVCFTLSGAENIAVDWGDGKKSNINDADRWEGTDQFTFSHVYSGTNAKNIVITGNVTLFSCSLYKLTALDVSRCPALIVLEVGSCELTALDVSQNTALKILDCRYNQLTVLDMSRNTALTELSCNSNQLTALDLSRNTSLTGLNCRDNKLTTLDLSRNTSLVSFELCNNQIINLKVSAEAPLRAICCKDNQLTASALNDLFISLPYIYEGTWASINYGGTNPGTLDCDSSIAEKKGWGFDQLHGSNAYR